MALWVKEASKRKKSRGLSGPHPVSSHFTHFQCIPSVAVLTVVPRVGGFAYIPGSPAVSSAAPAPSGFIARSDKAFFFPVLEPWAA